jgi:hypothetical protein
MRPERKVASEKAKSPVRAGRKAAGLGNKTAELPEDEESGKLGRILFGGGMMERKAAETMTVTNRKKRIIMSRLETCVFLAMGFVACLSLLASCGGGGNGSGDGTVLPSVTTLGSDMVSSTTASISGSINPNGKETEYWFEWATDESLTNPTKTAIQVLAASSSVQMVSDEMTGLTKGTTVYYRLCARNAYGTVQGQVKACYHYANVVFVTSEKGTGDLGSWTEAGGNTGIGAGDAICQTLADGAGLQGEFKAWLSDSTTAAKDRLARSAESYVRVDGVRVADNWSDFTAAPYLENPISINEQGLTLEYLQAWTGTRVDGSQGYGIFGNACLDWESGNPASVDTAAVGGSAFADYRWTEWGIGACYHSRALYCFQQNLALPQEHFSTGCPGPWGWVWHVSACSKGLYQDPDCAYVCCNFFSPTNNCYNLPATFGGYTVTSCSYDTGRYSMAVTRPGENFTVTCEVE